MDVHFQMFQRPPNRSKNQNYELDSWFHCHASIRKDKNQQDPNATEKFQSLQEAYEAR